MTMRRRRKKLSSLVYNMDRRIRSVELKKTIFRQAGLSPSVDDEVDTTLPEGTLYEGDAPNAWHRITGAYYYPARIIGNGDRAEIFLAESDSGLGVARGETISMSRLALSTIGVSILTDSDPEYYTVRAYGTPNWTLTASNTRQSKQVNGTEVYFPLANTGSGVGHTYLFSPGSPTTHSFPPFTLRYELKYRALVSKHSATTTTATLTISGGHHYQVDDIIEVMDLPSGYRGVDGVFRVKAVTSTTITYDFDAPLATAISEANASSNVYIYSVAQKYVRVGSTYINSTDGTVYYWNGIRYTRSAPPGLSNDGNAPSAPTNLILTTSGYNLADGSPRSRVDLSWTAPTTSAGGGALDDLAGYRIFVSETGYSNWTQKITYEKAVTSQTITNLDQNKQYYFRVVAYDSFGLDSTGLDGSQITGVAALSVTTPSAPVIPTVKLGVVTVKWDGKDSVGAVIPSQLLANIEVHASTSSGFTPSSSTLVGKIFSANDSCLVADLNYNTTYYFKFIANDRSGNSTTASVQTSAIIRPLVDADLIAAELNSPLSVWPFAPKAVTAGALADGALDASTVFGTGVITQNAIAANAIGANQIAANAITAGKIEAGAVTAAKIEALAISADKIATNAITADKISAGSITAAKLAAGTITGDIINGGLITGATLRTAASGERVEIGIDTFGTVSFYGSGGRIGGIVGMALTDDGGVTANWIKIDAGYVYVPGYMSVSGRLNVYGKLYTGLGLETTTIQAMSTVLTVTSGALEVSNSFFRCVDTRTRTASGGINVQVASNGTYHIASSSRKFKQDISPYSVDVDALLSLEPVTFRYKQQVLEEGDGAGTSVGFIAEDLVEKGLTEYVVFSEDEDGNSEPFAINYENMVVALQTTIKQLNDRITALESK